MPARLQTGGGARLPVGLQRDLDGRTAAVHAVMRRARTPLLVVVCAGAPGQAGWVRYLTGAPLWGQRTFVVLGVDHGRRMLITRSPDDANWYRLTTADTDVESTLTQRITPVDRLLAIVGERVASGGRVGFVHPEALSLAEAAAVRAALPGRELIDLTQEMRELREVKSRFEILAMRETGKVLAQALDLFATSARPGRLALEVAGELDGYLRGRGCSLVYLRYAFNQEPVPGPSVRARRFEADDIITVHLAYAGPRGYWGERSGVFTFLPLPGDAHRRMEAAERALRSAARAIAPRSTFDAVREAAARTYEALGAPISGRHAPDVHSIGADEDEDSGTRQGTERFREGMTVAVHPAPWVADRRGFFLARTFLVTARGAASLSPSRPLHRQLAAS
jgi:Xaa-Pro aminopeptidase